MSFGEIGMASISIYSMYFFSVCVFFPLNEWDIGTKGYLLNYDGEVRSKRVKKRLRLLIRLNEEVEATDKTRENHLSV